MWQRRALQAELGSTDALIQLSLDALKRFSATQSTGSPPLVSFITHDASAGGVTQFLPPGKEWSLSIITRSASVTSLVLMALDSDAAGNARLRWAVSFGGADETKTLYGKTVYGGIKASSGLGELVQQYEGLYGIRGPGLIASPFGKPIVTASQSSQKTWAATAELITPLTPSIRAANGAIAVIASLGGATLASFSSASFDATGTANLQAQLAARLGELLAGRIPGLCPEISTVGAIPTTEAVGEVLPVYVRLRVAGPAASALAVFISNNNVPTLPLASTDLTAGADCAYLARESVFQKTLAFCFRTNRFPKHWLTVVTPQATTNNSSVNVTTSIDFDSVSISLMPFTTTSARQEDRADLLMVGLSKVIDVRNPDGSAVSDDVRAGVSADATFNYTNDLYFSNVGMPGINSDPQIEAWFQLWRSQVSRRFSVPFVAIASSTLLERALNGVEKVMLSRQNLVF